jgi:hypothetical protein
MEEQPNKLTESSSQPLNHDDNDAIITVTVCITIGNKTTVEDQTKVQITEGE